MSAVVRTPSGESWLLAKGADNVMMERSDPWVQQLGWRQVRVKGLQAVGGFRA